MTPPWMPWYVDDYLSKTSHLTAAQHGAYMLLILRYWQKGGLPADDALLSAITRTTPKEWTSMKPVISDFFKDGWRHSRCDDELAKAKEKTNRRQEAGSRGGFAKAVGKQNPSIASPLLEQNPSNALALSPSNALASSSQLTSLLRKESAKPKLSDSDFKRFWIEMPKRIAEDAVRAKVDSIIQSKRATLEELVSGAKRFAQSVAETEKKYIAAPMPWLNGGRWKDDLDGSVVAFAKPVEDDPKIHVGGGYYRPESFIREAILQWEKNPRSWPAYMGPYPNIANCRIPDKFFSQEVIASRVPIRDDDDEIFA
jgi:uncharacterized protein YdaU (DUF1376 family)